MGNKTSVKFGCVSAPMDDGEVSYSSVPTKSGLKSKSNSKPNRRYSSHHQNTESMSYSSLSPPAPSTYSQDSEISTSHTSDYHHHHHHHHGHHHYNKMNVKILFLDVDGVLNNNYTKWDEWNNGIDDKLLKYLKLIILKTNCKIVLSTTWRLHENAKKILIHSLKTRADLNTDDILIGQTEDLKKYGKHRTNEIYYYLKCNKYRYNVLSWVAIDDLSLNKYDHDSMRFMDGHFIKTNAKIGISPENVLGCIDILNANDYQTNSYQYQRTQYYN